MSNLPDLLAFALQRHQAGDLQGAEVLFRQILTLNPHQAEALHSLGTIALQVGRPDLAVDYMRRSITVKPLHAGFHNNLGNALAALARWDEAAACYREALRLQPDSADAHFNLGHVVAAQKDLAAAVTCYRQALRIRPEMAEAHAALGWVLSDLGQADQAVASLEEAVQLRPSAQLQVALATRLPVIYQSAQELLAWRARLVGHVRTLRERGVQLDLTEQSALNVFYLPYQGFNDRDIQHELALLQRAPPQVPLPLQRAGGKIRVGILSSLFKAHTIGHWTRGLIAELSRDDFEVTVLALGSHDDEVARMIKKQADRHLEVPKHLPSARRLIGDQQLDVLLYTDLGMDPVSYALAFSRLARVQCVTLGHPTTTGIDTIDYFISTEDLETPESDQHYTETLVRLNNLPFCLYRPEPPSPLQPRAYFGLGQEDHVYVCLQYLFKFHPHFDELLGGILRRNPRGTLLLSQGLVPEWEQLLGQRFAVTLSDVVDRIRFLPLLSYPDYLNLLAVSDVQLDPVGFGGGSTSCEGLAVGLPIVTLPTKLMRGRITFALYKQMQMLDCVAATTQEYIDLAVRLGTDASWRESIRQKILDARGLLFENTAGIRALEEFFRRAART